VKHRAVIVMGLIGFINLRQSRRRQSPPCASRRRGVDPLTQSNYIRFLRIINPSRLRNISSRVQTDSPPRVDGHITVSRHNDIIEVLLSVNLTSVHFTVGAGPDKPRKFRGPGRACLYNWSARLA